MGLTKSADRQQVKATALPMGILVERLLSFMDDEGTKRVKQMITLFTFTDQFIPQKRCQSEQLRKQMLNNTDG